MKLSVCFLMLVVVFYAFGCNSKVGEVDLDNQKSVDAARDEAVDIKNLQQRGKAGEELIYVPNKQEPYTGWIKRMHMNGQMAMLVGCKDGKPHGSYNLWHENGQKQIEGNLKDGRLVGAYTEWNDNGVVVTQKQIKEVTGVNVFKSGSSGARRTMVINHMKMIFLLLSEYDQEEGELPPNLGLLVEGGYIQSSDTNLEELTTYWLHGQRRELVYIPGISMSSSADTIVLHTPEAENGKRVALCIDGGVRTMSEINFQAAISKQSKNKH